MSKEILYVCTKCFKLTSCGTGMQRCDCEPRQKIVGTDSPSGFHLCYICCIYVVGGTTRWSWEACETCLQVNKERKEAKKLYLPLGRHSVMNGFAIPMKLEEEKWDIAATELVRFTEAVQELEIWCVTRAKNMFDDVERWTSLSHVRVDTWEREFKWPDGHEKVITRKLFDLICGDVY